MTIPITGNQTCAICSTTAPSNPLETPCQHIFCRTCFILSQASQADDSCTLCGRATQISFQSLLDADIHTMDTQQIALQTHFAALHAKIISTTTMMTNHLGDRIEENPVEQVERRVEKIQLLSCLDLALTHLTSLENANLQVRPGITVLQRASQTLSTLQPAAKQELSGAMIDQGKPLSETQKQIQDATMLLQTALTAIAEKLENIR